MKTTTSTIYMKRWLEANGRTRTLPGDSWYLNFTNEMLPLIAASPLFANKTADKITKTVLDIALYFQDSIAQTGGWKLKNLSDVHPSFYFQNPSEESLLPLARQLYDRMDSLFEEAPINEIPSPETWVMDLNLLEIPFAPLPEVTPDSRLTKDVERCLQYSQGNPLLYFATYEELRVFLVGTLEWEDHPDGILADLKAEKDFVVYANTKGMLLAPGVAACFRDSHNPAYDAQTATAEGYELFCLPGRCPFDLLKYGMQNNLLCDAALPFDRGREILQQNWDFIARYFLGEYYEGD